MGKPQETGPEEHKKDGKTLIQIAGDSGLVGKEVRKKDGRRG